ncbi:MAG: hypothetical protein ACMVO3_17110 [Thalassobaculum sp.]
MPSDLDSCPRCAMQDKCKAIFVESLANPGGVIADIDAIARDRRRKPACR